MFAFVPPAGIWGGWLSFVVSLVVIGALTAIVGDLASIFGCLVGLNDAVTGNLIFVLRMRFMRVEEIQTELRKKKKGIKKKRKKFKQNSVPSLVLSFFKNIFVVIKKPQ